MTKLQGPKHTNVPLALHSRAQLGEKEYAIITAYYYKLLHPSLTTCNTTKYHLETAQQSRNIQLTEHGMKVDLTAIGGQSWQIET